MNTKVIWLLLVPAIVLLSWFIYSKSINPTFVDANPDYICIKNVSNTACRYDPQKDCDPWDTTGHTRTCHGKRTIQVAYYNLRTTCEKWYWNGSKVTTANDQVHYSKADSSHVLWIRDGKNLWGRWGRHSADFVYATEDCQVVETDYIPPTWKNGVSY